MRTRDDKLTAGFLKDGFTYKGQDFKPLTAQTLLILEKMKSPFFTGEGQEMRGLLDFLFVSSQPMKKLVPLLKSQDEWDIAVLEYAGDFSAADLEDLSQVVAESTEEASAAVVEVREEATTGKKS